jgi:hypothetical protein
VSHENQFRTHLLEADMRILVGLILAGGPFSAADSFAQGGPPITAADSIEIRTSSIRTLVDRVLPDSVQVALWIESRALSGSAGSEPVVPTAREFAAIRAILARVDLLPPDETGFDCPAGRRVFMPISGCPIREGRAIIQFGPMTVASDSLETTVSAIQSDSTGTRSWLHGLRLLFVRTNATWEFKSVIGEIMS